jgi:endonuclease/exonuclease/phosphatase (EEP) superfamily protein YafD
MLVNTERFPDGDVILHTKCTQWTSLAGGATPVFVGVCYVPCGPEADRQEAYDDMEEAITRFGKLGRVIIGGDFNARCRLNSDRLTNTAGRSLVKFCSQNALTMINAMPATTGKFSRIQRVVLNGTVTVQESTIDYVLVPTVDESSVLSLNLCDADLESDHRPLVFTTT